MKIPPLFRKKSVILALIIILAIVYVQNSDVYTVTAYCNCRICINKKNFRDGRFSSNQRVYFGGAAARKSIPFNTKIRLIPLSQKDKTAIDRYFKGRKDFIIEDRGFLITGNRIDIFIPKSMGGHKTALKWGKRKMRVKMFKP
ncbi:MAG: 3D domain-containing protein [Candidatus Omnitrophota bacterium]